MRMREWRETRFQCFSRAYELIQQIGGHLFVATDFMLSYSYKGREEVEAGHAFITDFVLLSAVWLRVVASFGEQVKKALTLRI